MVDIYTVIAIEYCEIEASATKGDAHINSDTQRSL